MASERRRLEELNLLDNFLFGTMVTHPDYGEAFSRHLLRLILNREIGKLKVVSQSVYFGSDPDQHGAILDAYLEEEDGEGETAVYDVEAEKDDHEKAVKAIPKRMRFYRVKLDGRGLKAGEEYGKLRKLIMIMITPFDPFGLGRMRYTVRNACLEVPEMPYDDGATMIFLNTKGNPDDESEELCQFLRYAECSTPKNAITDELWNLHQMVDSVKHDEEVSVRYMRLWESEESIRRKALEEGQAMERINTEKEKARADEAEARADEEKAKTAEEKARADEAERKVAELQAIIEGMKEVEGMKKVEGMKEVKDMKEAGED